VAALDLRHALAMPAPGIRQRRRPVATSIKGKDSGYRRARSAAHAGHVDAGNPATAPGGGHVD
jgi:hypothetical protein